MKPLLVIATLLVAFLSFGNTSPIAAQTATPNCDPSAVIKKAAALISAGDQQKDMASLILLREDISAMQIACQGMTWSANSNKVIGPINLAKGIYKASATNKGIFSGKFEVLEGKCYGNSEYLASFMSIIAKVEERTDETIIHSKGCKTFLSIESSYPWTLSLIPLQ